MTLREWMYEERVGTVALAKMLDVSPSMVTHLRKRRTNASDDLAAKILTITRGAVSKKELHREPPHGAPKLPKARGLA